MKELRERAAKTLDMSIEECTEVTAEQFCKVSKRNAHGIKILSSIIPEGRDGINDWFNKFTV